MRKKYLGSVDAWLRKQGYVLIDLHKERQMIGVMCLETIAQWAIPAMHHDSHESQGSADDAETSDRQGTLPTLDTPF